MTIWEEDGQIDTSELNSILSNRYIQKYGWIVVYFWTSEKWDKQKILEQTAFTYYNEIYKISNGIPKNLHDILKQVGESLNFSNKIHEDLTSELQEITSKIISPMSNSTMYKDFISCLYGDIASTQLGYGERGLPVNAGFYYAKN